MKLQRIIFSGVLAALVAAPFSFVAAQSPELQSALQSVSDNVEKISDVPASTTPSEAQELTARKTALVSVYTFTLIEITDLRKKVAGIKNDANPELWDLRNHFLSDMDAFAKKITDLQLAAKASTSVDDIKTAASDFKAWRSEIYNPEVQQLLDVLLLAQGRKVLKTADSRFTKITSDVKWIQQTTPSAAPRLQAYLTLASKNLREAQSLYNEAQDVFIDLLDAHSVASSSDNFASSSVDLVQNLEASSGVLIASSSPASSSLEQAVQLDPEARLQDLLKQSLAKISDTYKIFLEMSKFAKKALAN